MSGFGKLFAGLYEGSMLGAGVHVFALWPYCISRSDASGHVEVNPRLAAVVLGCSIPEVEAALDYLMRPDPESRSKQEDGRRIVRVGQFAYRIVNYLKYRAVMDAESRREYQRDWDRTHRPTRPDRARHVPTKPTQAEAEAEAEAEATEEVGAIAPPAPPKRARMAPPSEDEWTAYARETWPDWQPHDVASSWASYQSRGWRTPAGPVKDWHAAARTCYHRQAGKAATPPVAQRRALVGSHAAKPRDIEDAPDDIRAIARRISAREDVPDEDGARLGRWMRGEG